MTNDDLLDKFKNKNLTWLGFEKVSETEIQKHEARLHTNLPPSYREFLKVSNGFGQLSNSIWNILPVGEINWLKKADPSFYELYASEENEGIFNASDEDYFVYGDKQLTTNFRSQYLINSLAISGWGNSVILLLNPSVKFGKEWEAWLFDVELLGPVRYKSFEELIEEEYSSYLELLNS